MRIKLKPLPEIFFNEFLDIVIQDYTKTLYAHKSFEAIEDAHAHVKAHISFLLPQGPNSANHTILDINCTKKKHIGYLWIEFSTNPEGKQSAWINFIYIKSQERRKGFALEALQLLENILIEKAVKTIGLTVFGTNQAARNLYLSLNYSDTEFQKNSDEQVMCWHMIKKLGI